MIDELDDGDDHSFCRSRELPHSTALTLIWRLAAELVRRYPERLWVQPTGAGMYDRTDIIDVSGECANVVVTMNALGSGMALGSGVRRWTTAFAPDADRSEWLTKLARDAGLPARAHGLPNSTAPSLVARYVAAFLALQLGGRHDWIAVGPTTVGDQVKDLPELTDWQRANPTIAGRVVLLAERHVEAPRIKVALSADGDLWVVDGTSYQLARLHKSGAPATALLLATVPHLLP